MSVKSHILTTIRKATMSAPAPNIQKTSVGLGNLRAGDWWWWGDCAQKNTLYPLPGSIPGRPKIETSEAGKGPTK